MPAEEDDDADFDVEDDTFAEIDRLERERSLEAFRAPTPPAHPPKRRRSPEALNRALSSEDDKPARAAKRERSRKRRKHERRRRSPTGPPATDRPPAPRHAEDESQLMPPSLLPPVSAPAQLPAMIPMLHSVMSGTVQFVTPRGALMRLTDGGPARYLDGLLRKRPKMRTPAVGSQLFVKIVRLEAGLVIVDSRNVDAKTGQDKDPENECAEVESWVDIPEMFVGQIIGKNGMRIRKLCEETGADLRFDEAAPASAAPNTSAGGQRKAAGGAGAGKDLKQFLDAAKTDADDKLAPANDGTDGDDLRRFLQETKENADADDDGADLRRFFDDMKAGSREEKVVEFKARDLDTWEGLLFAKMREAGIDQIEMTNLTITDSGGRVVNIANGLHAEHFPIHVKYMVLAEEEEDKDQEPDQRVHKKQRRATDNESSAGEAEETVLAPVEKNSQDRLDFQPRPDAIHFSRAERLTSIHLEEIFDVKGLPVFSEIEHVSKSEVVCVFASASDAAVALKGLKAGFDDVPKAEREGPGLWRARNDELDFRMAHVGDVKEEKEQDKHKEQDMQMARLRINGDHVEVFKAEATVRALLSEFVDKRLARNRRVGILQPGEIEEVVEVESGSVGRLIGKGGETIRSLQEEYKVRVRVRKLAEDEEEDTPVRDVIVQGLPDDVHRGMQRIEALTARRDSSRHTAQKRGELKPGEAEECLKVLFNLVGGLLGKKGETIRRLEEESKARIQILPLPKDEKVFEQDVIVQGRPEAVADARKRIEATLERLASGLERKVKPRENTAPDREAVADSRDDEEKWQRLLQEDRKPRRQPMAAAAAEFQADTEDADRRQRRVSRSRSLSIRTKAQRLREERLRRTEEAQLHEYQLDLKKQRQLEQAAESAEAAAADAAKFAASVEADKLAHELVDSDLEEEDDDLADPSKAYTDWKEDSGAAALIGKPAMTPQGSGRVAVAILTRHTGRLLTVRLLAGGTVQAPERVVLQWIAKVESWYGDCLYPPDGQLSQKAREGKQLSPYELQQRAKVADADGPGFVVTEAEDVPSSNQLAWRLVPSDASAVRLVLAGEITKWCRSEPRVYLVELCTTPSALGHISPYRHDYRESRELYAKGDLVVLESSKPGNTDIGTICKVLVGAKAQRFLAATSTAVGAADSSSPNTRRVVRRCTAVERARRQGPMTALEAAALPLLKERLPTGAEALGVGASLDGSLLRLFVQFSGEHGARTKDATVAAAAGLGAFLGCETELLSGSARPTTPAQEGAQKAVERPIDPPKASEPSKPDEAEGGVKRKAEAALKVDSLEGTTGEKPNKRAKNEKKASKKDKKKQKKQKVAGKKLKDKSKKKKSMPEKNSSSSPSSDSGSS